MARTDAGMMNDYAVTPDAPRAYGIVIALAIVVALVAGAVFSFVAHGDEQTTSDEIAQLGD